MDLGQRLKEHRKSYGLTLAEMKEKTDLSISYLSDLERGRTNPSLETLKKLAGIYDTTASALMIDNGDDVKKTLEEIIWQCEKAEFESIEGAKTFARYIRRLAMKSLIQG